MPFFIKDNQEDAYGLKKTDSVYQTEPAYWDRPNPFEKSIRPHEILCSWRAKVKKGDL